MPSKTPKSNAHLKAQLWFLGAKKKNRKRNTIETVNTIVTQWASMHSPVRHICVKCQRREQKLSSNICGVCLDT